MDKIKFVVLIPEEATADVVRRKLAVTFAGGEIEEDTIEGRDAAESKEFLAEQDSVVNVSVVNVDDAGNESPPRSQDFTVADTFAPPEPGELGLKATGEVSE